VLIGPIVQTEPRARPGLRRSGWLSGVHRQWADQVPRLADGDLLESICWPAHLTSPHLPGRPRRLIGGILASAAPTVDAVEVRIGRKFSRPPRADSS